MASQNHAAIIQFIRRHTPPYIRTDPIVASLPSDCGIAFIFGPTNHLHILGRLRRIARSLSENPKSRYRHLPVGDMEHMKPHISRLRRLVKHHKIMGQVITALALVDQLLPLFSIRRSLNGVPEIQRLTVPTINLRTVFGKVHLHRFHGAHFAKIAAQDGFFFRTGPPGLHIFIKGGCSGMVRRFRTGLGLCAIAQQHLPGKGILPGIPPG